MTKKIPLTDQLNKDKKLFELHTEITHTTQEESENYIRELFDLLDKTTDESVKDQIAQEIVRHSCSVRFE